MKKTVFIVALGLSIGGCATKVEKQKVVCKDGVCTLVGRKETADSNRGGDIHKSNAVIEVTLENFDAVVKQATKPVVIDFYATWCPPCKAIKPVFEELANEVTDWVFASVDVDQAAPLAASCGVTAMPTFVVFKNGVQWGSLQGGRAKEQLMAELKEIAANDTPAVIKVESEQVRNFIMQVSQNNVDEVKKFIQEGVDVNGVIKSPLGDFTALTVAATTGTKEIIDILLDAGAQADENFVASLKRQLALYETMAENLRHCFAYAQESLKTHRSVEREIKLTGPEIAQQLCQAMGDLQALASLLDKGADVNAIYSIGGMETTLLYIALLANNRALIDLIIPAGASLAIEIADQTGCKKTIEALIQSNLELYDNSIKAGYAHLDYILSRQ